MKKSKVILAIVLAVVLLITILSVPTFSWFSRPHDHDGERAVFGGESGSYSINAYNGKDVSVASYSSNDGFTYSTAPTTNYSGSNIPNNNRKYFKTVLTNNSGTAQNVSLYARTLSIPTANNGTLALGVNGPTRSYRDYTTLAKANKEAVRDGSMRIYFQKNNNVTGWNGTEFYVCFKVGAFTDTTKGSDGTYYKLSYIGEFSGYHTYYADIPSNATQAFFAVENWGTNNNGQPNYAQRTQIMTNLATDGVTTSTSQVYTIQNSVVNGNTQVAHNAVTPAAISRYYDTVSVPNNDSNVSIALPTTWYTGSRVDYYSGDTTLFNVVNGKIQPVAGKTGTATLYTKVTGGSFSDTLQVETTVTITSAGNYEFSDVPIVKNIQMAADATVEVYWYVINNSPSAALTYTIDDVYIGL